MSKNELHVYGQSVWHDTVTIAGDKEALIALKNTIEKALEFNEGLTDSVFTRDGEGYKIAVLKTDLNSFPLPYTDEMARDKSQSKWENLLSFIQDKFFKK